MEIYIGTILLEKNRWRKEPPAIKVSQWLNRFAEDAFDGVELWERHYTEASKEKRESIVSGPLPIAVYNTYVAFCDDSCDQRYLAAKAAHNLKATAIKYNLGNDISRKDEYIRNLRSFKSALPDGCRLLCECHSGTIMHDPLVASDILDELSDSCYQTIVHGFSDPEATAMWLSHLKDRITHVHVSIRNSRSLNTTLRESSTKAAQCIAALKEGGFRGTYTLEFAKGLRNEDENSEDEYAAARDDLAFLREAL